MWASGSTVFYPKGKSMQSRTQMLNHQAILHIKKEFASIAITVNANGQTHASTDMKAPFVLRHIQYQNFKENIRIKSAAREFFQRHQHR